MFFKNQILSIQKKISETNDEALLVSLHANLESVQKAGKKSIVDLTTGVRENSKRINPFSSFI